MERRIRPSTQTSDNQQIEQHIQDMTERIDALDDEILFYQDRMSAFHNTNEFFRVLHRIDDLTREENHLYNEMSYEKQRLYINRESQTPNTDRTSTER